MWGKTQDFLETLVGFDMKEIAVILNTLRKENVSNSAKCR